MNTKFIAIIVVAIIVVISNKYVDKFLKTNIIVEEQEYTNSNKQVTEIKAKALIKKDIEIVAKAKIKKEEPVIVYDNLTMEELSAKLNRIMFSSLTGKGELFAKTCLEKGVDPYIALAIVFQETGCYYGKCSSMVVHCNNIGGMKGGQARCMGGSYAFYSTIDEGINNFISNLSNMYFSRGLNTPELINTRYAQDKGWSYKVNNYINVIRAS
mgnify:CR=1 FL=1